MGCSAIIKNMNMTEIQIPCPSYEIAADWYQNGCDRTLLVIPGYQSSKRRQSGLILAVALRHGFNALVLDYSGHGDSPIDISDTRPAQHLMETVCAFDWLSQQWPNQRISLMGTSYGGFQAAYLTRYRDFSRLVLRTPAIYPPEYMYTLSEDIPRAEIAQTYRKDAEAISRHPIFTQEAQFTGSALVVVHELDEDIPPATSNAYIDEFNAETYIGSGMMHWSGDPANPEGALEASYAAIGAWLVRAP